MFIFIGGFIFVLRVVSLRIRGSFICLCRSMVF